jgi:hypothetical protein
MGMMMTTTTSLRRVEVWKLLRERGHQDLGDPAEDFEEDEEDDRGEDLGLVSRRRQR